MRTRHNLRRISIHSTQVDPRRRHDSSGHTHILRGRFNLRVPELKHHDYEGADSESPAAADEAHLDEDGGNGGPGEPGDLVDGVVAPGGVVGGRGRDVSAACGEVVGEEHGVEGCYDADDEPV